MFLDLYVFSPRLFSSVRQRSNHAFEKGRSQAWLRTLALAVQRERRGQ